MSKTEFKAVRRLLGAVGVLALLLLCPAHPADAQTPTGQALWNPQGMQLSRPELEALLVRLEEASRSSAYSDAMRSQASAEAELVRARLENGDFRVGDQVYLDVEGETALQDTFTVNGQGQVVLPVIGPIDMTGVLRHEVTEHFTEELSRFIRDPVVRAQSLLRISVTGEVARPGFYTMPSTLLLSDALMFVGGPAPTADLERLRIERAGETIWDGDALQRALRDGRTLDQLSLQAGDQIVLPAQRNTLLTLRNLLYVVPAVVTLVALIGL